MSYDLTIAKISDDLQKWKSLEKKDWIDCSIAHKLTFIEKTSHPQQFLEIQNMGYGKFCPCFWIAKDFQTASFDSILLSMNSDVEKYAIHIATKLRAIIFGAEGELYFVPGLGKIENDKKMHIQPQITIMELKENKLNLQDIATIREYIANKS